MHRSLRRRTFSLSYLEGSLWAVMVGAAENFALYYAVRRGLNPHEVALISTLPVLFGAIFNWLSPLLTPARFLKAGILIGVFVQVLGVGILMKSVGAEDHFQWVFWGLSLYWIGGMGANPLWIDWMAAWLPLERFGRFYSRRSALLALVNLITFMTVAGLLYTTPHLSAFLWVFALGFVARIISGLLLIVQSNPPPARTESKPVKSHLRWSLRSLLFVMGLACVFKFVASIGTPFFLPYMVQQLKFNVFEVALTSGSSFLGLAILLPSFGEAVRSTQPLVGLQVAMMLAAANCLAWTLVNGIVAVSFLQFFSGLYWAAFDLACVLIIQSNFPQLTRKYLGFFMAIVTSATVGGSLVGSWLLESKMGYLQVFQASAYLRFLVAGILMIAFLVSPKLRVPLKTYGSFLRLAIQVNLTFIDFRRLRRGAKT